MLGGAAIAATGLSLLAGPLVSILFGSEYSAAIGIVRILAWMLVPYTLNSFLTLGFLPRGEERAVVLALGLSTLALATLTLWWVPLGGAAAAAWAALCAEIVQAALLVRTDFRSVRLIRSMLIREAAA